MKKILLIDDNEDLLQITQIILRGQGYETFLANSVKEAERKIKIHNPSLLLLDICIGEDDGRAFCTKLKSDPALSNLRVILMSGDETADACPVADDFLSKPFDFNELTDKVAKWTAVPEEAHA